MLMIRMWEKSLKSVFERDWITLGSFEILNQVGHLLGGDGGFEAFGHEGDAGAGEGFDLAAQDGVGAAVGAFEGEIAGGLAGDETAEGATVVGFDEVERKVGGDFAIGVEDVGDELLGGPAFDGSEMWADVVALVCEFVTDPAGVLVDFGSACGVGSKE